MKVLHQDASAEVLGVARVGLYGIWLVTLLMNPLWEADTLPIEWATLKGPAKFMPGPLKEWMLSDGFMNSLQIVLLVLCVALMVGVRPYRPLAISFGVLILLFDAIWKSFQGFSNHDKFASLYAVWIMSLYPAADGVSIMGPSKSKSAPGSLVYRAPMIAIPLILCTAYMLISLRRFTRGDVRIFVGDTMPIYFATRTMMYSYANFKIGLLVLTWPAFFVLSKVGYFVSTCFELSSPWTLLSDRFRRLWLLVILSFHSLTVPLMNIIFLTKMPERIAARFFEERDESPVPSTE